MKRFCMLGLVLLLFGSGCVTQHSLTSVEVFRVEVLKSHIGFNGWEFFWGTSGVASDPLDASLRLFAVKNDEIRRIETIHQLSQLDDFQVNSIEDANLLLAAFTSRESFFRFSPMSPMAVVGQSDVKRVERGFVVFRRLAFVSKERNGLIPVYATREVLENGGKYELDMLEVIGWITPKELGVPLKR